MTNIEEQFYKTFEIEPRQMYIFTKDYEATITSGITDRILLELICIYNSTYTNGYTNYSILNERNVEKLKEQILKNCLIVRDEIKQQVQALFKGEE